MDATAGGVQRRQQTTKQKAIEIITNTIQTDDMTEEQDRALAVIQNTVSESISRDIFIESMTKKLARDRKVEI